MPIFPVGDPTAVLDVRAELTADFSSAVTNPINVTELQVSLDELNTDYSISYVLYIAPTTDLDQRLRLVYTGHEFFGAHVYDQNGISKIRHNINENNTQIRNQPEINIIRIEARVRTGATAVTWELRWWLEVADALNPAIIKAWSYVIVKKV